MLHTLGAILLVVVVPMAVLYLLVGELGAGAMLMGFLFGVVGCKIGGTRRMLYLAPAIALAAGLGSFTAYDWSWVALLGVAGAVMGAGIGFGWLPPLLMLPFSALFVIPGASGRDAVIYGVIVGIATLYAAVLARRSGIPEVVEGQHQPPSIAVGMAVVFGMALAGAAAIGVALGWTEPYWVPEPILVLGLYIIMGTRDRIRGKAIGTAAGAIATIPVAIVSPPGKIIALIAAVAFVLALTQSKTYWLSYGLYTFSIILALSAPGHVGTEAAHRGSEILGGIGILVVGLALIHALDNWLTKRHPRFELVV